MCFGDKAQHTTPPAQQTNSVSAFGGSDISCRSIHVCVCRKEQTRATDRAAVASVWQSLPGVMVPCGCLCIVLSSYCQLFTRDSIPSGNENLASLARPYFPFLPSPFRSRMRVHGIRSGSRDQELMSGEAAKERVTTAYTWVPSKSKSLAS